MNHIDSALDALPEDNAVTVIVIVALAVAGFVLLFASARRAESGRSNAALVSVGFALLVTACTFLGATLVHQVGDALDGLGSDQTAGYQNAIFTEYGLDLDLEKVGELGFPQSKPELPRSFGTTEVVGFDGDVVRSIEVRLIWDGEQYLLIRSVDTGTWVLISG